MSPIPAFDLNGLLPPFMGMTPTDLAACAPYQVGLVELCQRFGTSARRCEILLGLLRYRADLRGCGITAGWNWIDGSFCQALAGGVEPGDIDMITFIDADAAAITAMQAASLVDPAVLKANYHCDGYYLNFRSGPAAAVQLTAYWYGLFSHTKVSLQWKGMLSVDLDATDDAAARVVTETLQAGFNA